MFHWAIISKNFPWFLKFCTFSGDEYKFFNKNHRKRFQDLLKLKERLTFDCWSHESLSNLIVSYDYLILNYFSKSQKWMKIWFLG